MTREDEMEPILHCVVDPKVHVKSQNGFVSQQEIHPADQQPRHLVSVEGLQDAINVHAPMLRVALLLGNAATWRLMGGWR